MNNSTFDQVSEYLDRSGLIGTHSPIGVWQHMDRDYPGDRATPKAPAKTGSKKKNCSPKSNPCGNACVPIKKKCRKGGVSSAQERLRRLRKAGAESGDIDKAKSHINDLTVDKRTSRNENTIDALRQRLKGRVFDNLKSSSLAEIPPSSIEVDPKRFQYKIAGELTKSGTVGSLRGVQTYDPNLAGILQVWKDPADNKTYVVNGHNRLDLANKLGAEEVAVRYIKAPDAKTARSIGALTNIAEGRGDALDSAKFFRDTGISKEDLVKRGIPMREKIAQDGLALSKLDDSLFRKTIDGDITIARASIIGGSGLDHSKQRDLSNLIDKEGKKRNLTDSAISEMVDIAKSSSSRDVEELSLFGSEFVAKSNMLEKAQLQSAIKKRLGREKKLFGTVAKSSSAEDLARGGNTIDREQSGAISQKADRALQTFDKLKGLSGPISKAINEAADRVAKGENAKKVEKELYETILNTDAFGNLAKKSDSLRFDRADLLNDFSTNYPDHLLSQVYGFLNRNGLSDRYDAYEVFTHMDAFVKKAGIAKGGGKCGRGWVGIKGSCDRMKQGGDRAALQKQSLNKFAVSQRSKKDLPEKGFVALRRSIAGKGGHPAGSPADQKEKSRAKFGGYGDVANRTERLQRKEEQRSIVSQGGLKQRKANAAIGPQEFDYVNPSKKVAKSETDRTPAQKHVDKKVANLMAQDLRGDLSREQQYRIALKGFSRQAESAETPEERKSGAVLRDRMQSALDINDKFKAKQKKVTPIEQGKSLKQLFGEADAIGPKSEPMTMAERRSAKQGADKILGETGYTEAAARASGKVRSIGGASSSGTRKETSTSKQGDRVRNIADRLATESKVQKKAAGGLLTAAAKLSQNHENTIAELGEAMDRAPTPRKAALTTENVNPFNAKQGRQFAEQQGAQAKAEGRSADAKKWQDEARLKSRSELATLMQGKSANQQNLFGVTEHASDMPLFNQPSPKASGGSGAGDRIRNIADRLGINNAVSSIATERIARAASTIGNNQDRVIDEGAATLNAQLDRTSTRSKAPLSSPTADRRRALADRVNQGPADKDLQKAIDNAPVAIPNSRKSSEPRRRGRSVD